MAETLPDEFWQSRHRFLLGLTWLHATLIALVGPLRGYRWDISFAAIFEDGMVLHTIAADWLSRCSLPSLRGGRRDWGRCGFDKVS
jgi:hypothetical protein